LLHIVLLDYLSVTLTIRGLTYSRTKELALQRSPHDVVGQTRAQVVFLQEGGVPGKSDIRRPWMV